MIITPHILIGAAIGSKVDNFWLVAILGIVSHFILDKIPHWDYYLPNGQKIKNLKKMMIDGLVGILITVTYIYFDGVFYSEKFLLIMVGVFFALLPDILWFLFFGTKNKIAQRYISFHHNSHYIPQKEGVITFLGVFSQVAVIAISLLFLFAF